MERKKYQLAVLTDLVKVPFFSFGTVLGDYRDFHLNFTAAWPRNIKLRFIKQKNKYHRVHWDRMVLGIGGYIRLHDPYHGPCSTLRIVSVHPVDVRMIHVDIQ